MALLIDSARGRGGEVVVVVEDVACTQRPIVGCVNVLAQRFQTAGMGRVHCRTAADGLL